MGGSFQTPFGGDRLRNTLGWRFLFGNKIVSNPFRGRQAAQPNNEVREGFYCSLFQTPFGGDRLRNGRVLIPSQLFKLGFQTPFGGDRLRNVITVC